MRNNFRTAFTDVSYRICAVLILTSLAEPIFAGGSDYFKKPCDAQAGDAKELALLREGGRSFAEVRQSIERTRPEAEQPALVVVLTGIYSTMKGSTPNEIHDAVLWSCNSYGKSDQRGPATGTISSPPTGILSESEKQECLNLYSQGDKLQNEFAEMERKMDGLDKTIAASKMRLYSMGSEAPSLMVDRHNAAVDELNRTENRYVAVVAKYNEVGARFNSQCKGKLATGP